MGDTPKLTCDNGGSARGYQGIFMPLAALSSPDYDPMDGSAKAHIYTSPHLRQTSSTAADRVPGRSALASGLPSVRGGWRPGGADARQPMRACRSRAGLAMPPRHIRSVVLGGRAISVPSARRDQHPAAVLVAPVLFASHVRVMASVIVLPAPRAMCWQHMAAGPDGPSCGRASAGHRRSHSRGRREGPPGPA